MVRLLLIFATISGAVDLTLMCRHCEMDYYDALKAIKKEKIHYVLAPITIAALIYTLILIF